MGAGWESVPLGEVLHQRPPHVQVDPTQCYQFARASTRSHAACFVPKSV